MVTLQRTFTRALKQTSAILNAGLVGIAALAALVTLVGCTQPAENPPTLSTNADLSAITVSVGSLSPEFSSAVTDYTVKLAYTQGEITVTGTAADSKASVGGDSGKTITLDYGDKSVSLVVTAESGATKTYTIVVTRSSPLSLVVAFNKNADDATGTMADQAITQGATASLTDNAFARSGYTFEGWATSAAGEVAYANGATLAMGDSGVTLFAVWKAIPVPPSTDATLSAITLDRGTLSPAFDASKEAYTVSLPYTAAAITVTGTVTDKKASVAGDSGKAISLPYGDTTVSLVVTAENGDKKTYAITVTRASPLNLHVSFDKNAADATGTMADKAILQGASSALTVNSFKRTGFDFGGWATSAGGEVAYADGANYAMGDENAVLYAVWLAQGTVSATLKPYASDSVSFSGETSVVKGNDLVITVDTAGLGSFAWYLDGDPLAGKTTGVLTLATTTMKAGMYYLMVTARDAANVRYSAGLTVTVTN